MSASGGSLLALLEGMRAGDGEAGEQLQARTRASLLRFARRLLGSEHDGEDAVQEAYMRMRTSDVVPTSFRSWSLRILRNICLNRLRALGSGPAVQPFATRLELPADQTGALTRLLHSEDQADLQRSLARLSAAQYEVLTLRYLEGLSRGEIAAVLELSESTVKSRLFEAVESLRRRARG